VFGICNSPNFHGHNYNLDVSVEGEIDPETGYVLDIGRLKQIITECLVQHMDHKNLNLDVAWFRELNPTVENIAVVCWRVLVPAVAPVRFEARPPVGDRAHLRRLRRNLSMAHTQPAEVRISFQAIVHEMLEQLGEDPQREGLRQTPARVEASLKWLTRGYGMDVEEVVGDAVFQETHESMICVRDIEIYSMCEHHMLPFSAEPRRLPAQRQDRRVVEDPAGGRVFARRLQYRSGSRIRSPKRCAGFSTRSASVS